MRILVEDRVVLDHLSYFSAIFEVVLKAEPKTLRELVGKVPFSECVAQLCILPSSSKEEPNEGGKTGEEYLSECFRIRDRLSRGVRMQIGALEILRTLRESRAKVVVFGTDVSFFKKVLEQQREDAMKEAAWLLEEAEFLTLEEEGSWVPNKENEARIYGLTASPWAEDWCRKRGAHIVEKINPGLTQALVTNFRWSDCGLKKSPDFDDGDRYSKFLSKVYPSENRCTEFERQIWAGHVLLERPSTFSGPVVEGFQRGSKQLGVPTANLVSPKLLEGDPLPCTGVYFGFGEVEGFPDSAIPMVMSFGYNPFFDNKHSTVEPHFFRTFPDDFHGAQVRLRILGFLRAQSPYPNFECLLKAIQLDCEIAREILTQIPGC